MALTAHLSTATLLPTYGAHIGPISLRVAALWLALAAAASSAGIIHSPTLDPYKANQIFPIMYLLAAAILCVCHALQNRAEQIRELQVGVCDRM